MWREYANINELKEGIREKVCGFTENILIFVESVLSKTFYLTRLSQNEKKNIFIFQKCLGQKNRSGGDCSKYICSLYLLNTIALSPFSRKDPTLACMDFNDKVPDFAVDLVDISSISFSSASASSDVTFPVF